MRKISRISESMVSVSKRLVELFRSDVDYLEILDDHHSGAEDRFIALGPIRRGLILIIWTERHEETIRIIMLVGRRRTSSGCTNPIYEAAMTEIAELTAKDLARALP